MAEGWSTKFTAETALQVILFIVVFGIMLLFVIFWLIPKISSTETKQTTEDLVVEQLCAYRTAGYAESNFVWRGTYNRKLEDIARMLVNCWEDQRDAFKGDFNAKVSVQNGHCNNTTEITDELHIYINETEPARTIFTSGTFYAVKATKVGKPESGGDCIGKYSQDSCKENKDCCQDLICEGNRCKEFVSLSDACLEAVVISEEGPKSGS